MCECASACACACVRAEWSAHATVWASVWVRAHVPWLGDSGNNTCAGWVTIFNFSFLFLMAPMRRSKLMSMSRCDSSEWPSSAPTSRPIMKREKKIRKFILKYRTAHRLMTRLVLFRGNTIRMWQVESACMCMHKTAKCVRRCAQEYVCVRVNKIKSGFVMT